MMLTRLRALSARAARIAAAALAAVTLGAALVSCGGSGSTPVTGVKNLRPLSAEFTKRKAVAYSPYRTSAGPQDLASEVITKAQIKQDLDLLVAGGFGLIRLFDSSDKVAKQTLEVIRDNSMDIKVMLGAYLAGGGNSKSSANDQEVARAIALANQFSAIVLAVSIGNEMLLFDLGNKIDSPSTLAGYIARVRASINQPVTTDDNYGYWKAAKSDITDVIDFVAIHSYVQLDTIYAEGLWDWQQLGASTEKRAAAMMDAAIAATQAQYQAVRNYLDSAGLGNLPIVVGETGWKNADTGGLRFRASPANAKMYYDRMRAWEAASRTGTGPRAIFHFEAFDEPWKQADDKWGLFTVDRKVRCSIQALNPESATWVYDKSMPCDAASALYFQALAVPAVVTANRFTLYADAATAGEAVLPSGRWDAFDGSTASYPPVMTAAAPGDGPNSIEITPSPAAYGWGLLRSSSAAGSSFNLSGFASGSVKAWIKTNGYPGKIEIGITTDTEDRKGAEAYLQIAPGDYGYCNTGAWCQVSIPLSAFVAVNPKLDLRAVLLPFVIADRYSFTGKPLNSGITTKITIDAIYWSK